MAVSIWFKTMVDDFARNVAQVFAHVLLLAVFIGAEFAIYALLMMPGLPPIAQDVAKIVEWAMPVTFVIFSIHICFTMALTAWLDAQRQLAGGLKDWRMAAVIIGLLGVVTTSCLLIIEPPSITRLEPSFNPKETAVLNLITASRGEANPSTTLLVTSEVITVVLAFTILTEEKFSYLASVDGKKPVTLEFSPGGATELTVPRSSLSDGTHQLRVSAIEKLIDRPREVKAYGFAIESIR